MKERPILFSGEMVKAILDGRKTQTRRAVKPQPLQDVDGDEEITWEEKPIETGWESEIGTEPCFAHWQLMRPGKLQPAKILCPYGVVGDRLWVKETYAERADVNWREEPDKARRYCFYKADDANANSNTNNWHSWGKWKSGRFMPRCLSRLTLEITGVRVERLQDISHKDALAEGVKYDVSKEDGSPLARYQQLWNKINGPGSWDANPFVWVIEFKKI